LGKYTPFYWLLYEHFPGINNFRVPKMMMFLPVLGLGVLAARGLDILLDGEVRQTVAFRRYIRGLLIFPALLVLLLLAEIAGKNFWITNFYEMLAHPTRFEQGSYLVAQRWSNLVGETGLATALAVLYAGAIFFFSRRRTAAFAVFSVLAVLYCVDVGRVDSKFMLLQDVPQKVSGEKTPVIKYLAGCSRLYRVLPIDNTDPMEYVSNGIPVMFTSNPVQHQRWQSFLDSFSLSSSMPDMLNVKYLICSDAQYNQIKVESGDKYKPVFISPDGKSIVLENRTVLPKAWLVPAAGMLQDPRQTLSVLGNPGFNPRNVAIVETPPPITMADPDAPPSGKSGDVAVTRYEGEQIDVKANIVRNCLLVLGEKYYRWWYATVDGKSAEIYPVDHILRGVYLTPGEHTVEFVFDPLPFKIGKYLTLASFLFFAVMLGREFVIRKKRAGTGESEESV
jgi:hypothetical protein